MKAACEFQNQRFGERYSQVAARREVEGKRKHSLRLAFPILSAVESNSTPLADYPSEPTEPLRAVNELLR